MSVNNFDYQEVEEIIDFLSILSICYHLNKGNARRIKKCARALKARFTRRTSRNYCDKVIADPDEAFFIINTISQGHFSILALRDPSKQFVLV
jgi:hypothetical protein